MRNRLAEATDRKGGIVFDDAVKSLEFDSDGFEEEGSHRLSDWKMNFIIPFKNIAQRCDQFGDAPFYYPKHTVWNRRL
jgi:hypothetical protein